MEPQKTGRMIRDLRTKKGMTQQALAEALKVSQTAVSKWENGRNLPDISMLEPLADVLGVSIYEIVLGEKNTPEETQDSGQMGPVQADTAIRSVIDESIAQKKKSNRKIIRRMASGWLLAASLLFAVCLWRFWPHSLSQVLPAEPAFVTEIQANAVIATVENNDLQMSTWETVYSRDDEGWREILSLLLSAAYQKDLRNPFLPLVNGFSADFKDSAVYLLLRWGTDPDKSCRVDFLSDRQVMITPGDGSCSCLYHPTNRDVREQLAEYIQQNGEKK